MSERFRWLIRLIFCLVALASSAGCAAQESQLRAIDPSAVSVPPAQGLLALRIVSNNVRGAQNTGAAGGPLFFGSARLTLKSVPNGKTYKLDNKAGRSAGYALFLEPLPPGRYQVVEMTTQAGLYITGAPLDKQTAPFEIEADRITDLSALALIFAYATGTQGEFGIAQIVSMTPDDTTAALQSMNQDELKRLLAKPPLRPGTIVDPMTSMTVLMSGFDNASITAQAPMRDGQKIAFGRALGGISIWDPATQHWSSAGTGRSFPVRAVAFDTDGSLIVGMEAGLLLVQQRDGRYRRVAPPVPNAITLFIGRAATGEYLVVVEDRNTFVVASSPSLMPPAWTELRRIPIQRFMAPSTDTRLQFGLTREKLVVFSVTGGPGSEYTAHGFDLTTRAWDDVKITTSFGGLPRYTVFDGGTFATQNGGSVFNRAISWSDDWGRTWRNTRMESSHFFPTFRDKATIYVYSRSATGGTLSKSADGGATWTAMGPLPAGFTEMYVLPRPGYLLTASTSGFLYVSADDGKSWVMQ